MKRDFTNFQGKNFTEVCPSDGLWNTCRKQTASERLCIGLCNRACSEHKPDRYRGLSCKKSQITTAKSV